MNIIQPSNNSAFSSQLRVQIFALSVLLGFAFCLPSRLLAQPPNVVGTVFRNGQLIQLTADPVASMVASAASFDMDSPVEARAEFEPPIVAPGGKVIYRVVITALDESLSLPEKLPVPPRLDLIPGGRGQAYQSTGGMKIRPQTTLIYHLTAKDPGTFTIPAFDATAYGQPLKIPAATLEIKPAAMVPPAPPPLRLIVDLPAGNCYVGELEKISLMLPVLPENKMIGLLDPSVKGEFIFSEPAQSFSFGQQMIARDGKMIPAFVQHVMITPLREGDERLVVQAHVLMNATNGPPYRWMVDSDPVILPVKPLPRDGVLAGFNGAVGNFQMDRPVLSTNEVRAGEPIELTVVIRGDGNLGRMKPPALPTLKNWQAFPPPADPTPSAAIQQSGFVTFTYTLIPLTYKESATPEIPFSFFDPVREKYFDLSIPPVPVKINPAPVSADEKRLTVPDAPNPDAQVSAKPEMQIGFSGLMKRPGKVLSNRRPLQQRPWFFALQLLPAGILGALWYREKRNRYLRENPQIVLKRRARKQLRKQLRVTRRAAQSQNRSGFILGATSALREACAPYNSANPDALVCADVLQTLPAEQQGRHAETVRKLFNASNALRFGAKPEENGDVLQLQPDLEVLLAELNTKLQ